VIPGGGNSGSSDSGWNPFKWLTDLLKDIVETILKGLWKLLTSIFRLYPLAVVPAVQAVPVDA